MRIVINSVYGGFGVPSEVCERLGCRTYDDNYPIRTSPELIEWVEQHPENGCLVIVDIPDNATDFTIYEHDGWEWVVAVVDGKIVEIAD